MKHLITSLITLLCFTISQAQNTNQIKTLNDSNFVPIPPICKATSIRKTHCSLWKCWPTPIPTM